MTYMRASSIVEFPSPEGTNTFSHHLKHVRDFGLVGFSAAGFSGGFRTKISVCGQIPRRNWYGKKMRNSLSLSLSSPSLSFSLSLFLMFSLSHVLSFSLFLSFSLSLFLISSLSLCLSFDLRLSQGVVRGGAAGVGVLKKLLRTVLQSMMYVSLSVTVRGSVEEVTGMKVAG